MPLGRPAFSSDLISTVTSLGVVRFAQSGFTAILTYESPPSRQARTAWQFLMSEFCAPSRARFHVQVEISSIPSAFQTPAAIPVEGRVVRIFRGDSSLSVGDELTFHVNVCRRDDRIPHGPAYLSYEAILPARYMEIFLDGTPPCVGAVDTGLILSSPTKKPQLEGSRLAYSRARLKWAIR